MESSTTIRKIGLKALTVAAVAILIFSALSLFITNDEGATNITISVDEENEFKLIKKGQSVIHEIEVQNNDGLNEIFVDIDAEVTHITTGPIGFWSVRILDGVTEIENLTLFPSESRDISIEVTCHPDTAAFTIATISVTGMDGIVPSSGPIGPMNVSGTQQGGVFGTSLTLTTRVGQNYNPIIEIAEGTDDVKEVNPNTPTSFKVKVTNLGMRSDSIFISATAPTPAWRIDILPSQVISNIDSLDYAFVYINVTSGADAFVGDYGITITATSSQGAQDSIEVVAQVPLPDLYANADDIVFSHFPVIKNEEMYINITIHNKGGATRDSFKVNFWIQDTNKETDALLIIDQVEVEAMENGGSAYAKVTFSPELSSKIADPLTPVDIRVNIDADSDIIESDENNNQVDGELEIMQTPKAKPGFSSSLWMMVTMVAISCLFVASIKWNRKD